MNLYLDSSALLKLVWEEAGRGELQDLARGATQLLTSAVAYAEVRSAIARGLRSRREDAASARKELDAIWPQIAVLPVDEPRARVAGDIAERHLLRGMDALHVGAAVELAAEISAVPLVFASWDRDQRDAAAREGLGVFPARL